MKIAEFSELQKKIFDDCVKTAENKGNDYATEQDTFASFDRVLKVIEVLEIDRTTRVGSALGELVGVLNRICNLIRKGTADSPSTDSLFDSVRDGHVYLNLFYGMWLEDVMSKSHKERT